MSNHYKKYEVVLKKKNKGSTKKMTKAKTVDTVRERERERERVILY